MPICKHHSATISLATLGDQGKIKISSNSSWLGADIYEIINNLKRHIFILIYKKIIPYISTYCKHMKLCWAFIKLNIFYLLIIFYFTIFYFIYDAWQFFFLIIIIIALKHLVNNYGGNVTDFRDIQ